MKSLRILLVGNKGVGKSAIAVRFLTKRYIGEYQVDCEMLYRQTITCDDITLNLEILDFSKSESDDWNSKLENIKNQIIWAQAYVIVYSICDRKSFQAAQYYVNIINKIKGISTIKVPIVLLGNKRDLEIGRQVGLEEGRSLAIKYGCQFFEISAAENYIGVTLAFHGLLREARTYYDRSLGSSNYHSGQAIRKLSLNSVTRAFGAVFGSKTPSTPSPTNSFNQSISNRERKLSYLNESNLWDKHRRPNNNSGIVNSSCKNKKDFLMDNHSSAKQTPPIASL